MQEAISFNEQIEANRSAERVSPEVSHLEGDRSSLDVRLRGCYITSCELTSPSSGERISILYSDPDLTKPKISASHIMMPAGPYEGVGGQHGFPRWADYRELRTDEDPDGIKRIAFQAISPNLDVSLSKAFELTDSTMASYTKVSNHDSANERTSLGEHKYFNLEHENINGLKVNGKTLDELLGAGSEDFLMHDEDGTLNWSDFGGEAVIDFPAGYTIKLSADFKGDTELPVAMWIWHRKGSPSICFEPVVGTRDESPHNGIELEPSRAAVLSTKIELL